MSSRTVNQDFSQRVGGIRGQQQEEEPNALVSEGYVPLVMPRVLTAFDLTVLFALALFWISNVYGLLLGGAAAFTYWILGAVLFFVPCCIVCAQLGKLFPHEGSIYNWTYRAFRTFNRPSLANFMSFFIAICAWLPGLLSIVSAADVIVSCMQALKPTWLATPWQQGLVIIAVVVLTGAISIQRTRTVQNLVNFGFAATALAVLLIALSASLWLLKGHHSATNFADPAGWQISFDPTTGNIFLLGTVTLALLGATGPLMMAGEIKARARKAVTSHFLWGGLLVLVAYFVTTWALLVVEGQNAAFNTSNPVQLLFATVQAGLGSLAADVTAICVMFFFIIVAVIYNVIFARLLMCGGIDRRLPLATARLNRNRVPVNAVLIQTGIAVGVTLIIFFVLPFFTFLGDPATLTNKAYLVTAAALLLIWAFSFLFPFVDLLIIMARAPRNVFARLLILPRPVLVISSIAGMGICLATIIDTLLFSFAPALIANSAWTIAVGTYALICLIVCAIAGMVASSEADVELLRYELDTLGREATTSGRDRT
jgi:amino acid transporter